MIPDLHTKDSAWGGHLSFESCLFRFQPPGPVRARPKKKILQLRSLYALTFDAPINCGGRPQLICAESLMCFGFHARFVSVGSKVGCTAIMCNCDVALSVLRNRFLSMRSIEFDWSIEVRLLIWSIKFRSSDLIDWAIANVWCVIVHQSHF